MVFSKVGATHGLTACGMQSHRPNVKRGIGQRDETWEPCQRVGDSHPPSEDFTHTAVFRISVLEACIEGQTCVRKGTNKEASKDSEVFLIMFFLTNTTFSIA